MPEKESVYDRISTLLETDVSLIPDLLGQVTEKLQIARAKTALLKDERKALVGKLFDDGRAQGLTNAAAEHFANSHPKLKDFRLKREWPVAKELAEASGAEAQVRAHFELTRSSLAYLRTELTLSN